MFNKPGLFPKRDTVEPTPAPATAPTPSQPTSNLTRPTPRPGTFGAHMRSQTETPTDTPRATQTPQSESAEESGSRLIVGPDVKLKGAEILDCDTLVVEGRVEATMDSRVIRITEHGAFSGKVGIDVAEIHGHFDGELTARKQLIIHATGRVSGKIRYGKILIEEGGEVSGDVQSLTSAKAERQDYDSKTGKDDKVKSLMASAN
ncbi:bactofilin family protein [Denitromonas iodatirespirans]|uniref:bactofilin family protein n=1 Tax=Denitromonas iodatirespirans TaxID=2795389 RepID=UPI001E2FF54A|nr:polymer-forming cytoskeletal protein [Denitromonas iodatirespirans]